MESYNSKVSFKDNRESWILLISIWLLYTAMMAVKAIYPAEIIEVMKSFGINKTTASYANTAYYLTYGFMQLAVAKIIPKVNLRRYLAVTVSLSAVCTVLVGMSTKTWHTWVLLGLNGIFHAAIAPCCVLAIDRYLPVNMQSVANGFLSTGFAVGFIISYALSALFIAVADWSFTFYIFGFAMLPIIVLFIIRLKKAQNNPDSVFKNTQGKNESVKHINYALVKKYLRIFYLLVLVLNLFLNILYYGISNWIPNLMYDEFNMPSSLSTFLSVLVPVASIFGPIAAISLRYKLNIWRIVIVFTAIPTVFMFAMLFLYKWNFALSLMLSVLSLLFLRGAFNSTSMTLTLKMRRIFNTGVFFAVNNAFSSFGASLSQFTTGIILDNFGRTVYYVVLVILGLLSILLIGLCYFATKKLKLLKNAVLSFD